MTDIQSVKIGITFPAKPRATDEEYRQAISTAGQSLGAPPVEICELRPGSRPLSSSPPEIVATLSALLLSGGADLDPACYGETIRYRNVEVERERDLHELALLKAALRRDIPILAICRGIQVLNVALGGSLYQDIFQDLQGNGKSPIPAHGDDSMLTPEERRKILHEIRIVEKNSHLYTAFEREHLEVNSRHHQAIRRVAPGLKVTAHAPDGIIEGAEAESYSWVVGVQWHPEAKEIVERFRPLFHSFVQQVAARIR